MFTESAAIYDAIYESFHDYDAEADQLDALIRAQTRDGDPGARIRLLDVACGTGLILSRLQGRYVVEGLDLDPSMLDVARRKCPDVALHKGDMVDFDLGRRFDAVICVGSSIGYARTVPRMRQAVASLARHVAPGGVLIVEPWLEPRVWEPGRLAMICVDRPGLKIARMTVSEGEGRASILHVHYLVAAPAAIDRFQERHELGLFTREEHLDAFRAAGLDVTHDPVGLTGRGLYVATPIGHG